MIYIIDDKKTRQKNYAPWLSAYEKDNWLVLIYDFAAMQNRREEIINNASFVALHDSFFRNSVNSQDINSASFLKNEFIQEFKERKIHFMLISGDFNRISIDMNGFYHSQPVDKFYKNLKPFLLSYPEIDPMVLGFGVNYVFEEAYEIRESILHRLFELDDDLIITRQSKFLDFQLVNEVTKILDISKYNDAPGIKDKLEKEALTKNQLIRVLDFIINQIRNGENNSQ